MIKENAEALSAWYFNILVTYRVDYFRGSALTAVVGAISHPEQMGKSLVSGKNTCITANKAGFKVDMKYYPGLFVELRRIAKEVPLSDIMQTVIYRIFRGDWEEAIEAIDKLDSELIEDGRKK